MNYSQTDLVTENKIELLNFLPNIGIDNVVEEIYKGLSSEKKYISPKFFYDGFGSELFEQITHLDEYYPTRTEKSIISTIVKDLDIDFKNLNIIELGSGDASKISLFLEQIPINELKTINYFPVDISQSAIEKSANKLQSSFQLNNIMGVVIDFFHQLNLIPKQGKRLFCFFGSTIGNFNSDEAIKFINSLSNNMQKGDSLLLGMDMVKDIKVLENAYNDKKGVTAEFNLNMLNIVNNLTGTNFNKSDFEHYAYFNTEFNRIEMHLRAKKDIVVNFPSKNDAIILKKGETIHTENSHKFTSEKINEFAEFANLTVNKILTDDKEWFSLAHYIKNN